MNVNISVDILTFLQELIETRKTSYQEASDLLSCLFSGKRGFSAKTVRRFCADNNIRSRSLLDDYEIDRLICVNVSKVYIYICVMRNMKMCQSA